MTKYYAQVMLAGYRDLPKVEIEASTDKEAIEKSWQLSKATPESIAFSTAKKVGRAKLQWIS